jgi:Ser/Thr protein kinase RdoA (MazF antagonist)
MKLHSGQIEGTHENIARILEEYGISNFTFTPIKQGIENMSFRIQSGEKEYVLRVYRHKKKPEADIQLELNFQEILRSNNIPVPPICSTDGGKEIVTTTSDGKEHHAILMAFVEGASVTKDPSKALCAELATYQARMHLLGIEFAQVADISKRLWNDLRDGIAEKVKDPSAYGKEAQAFIDRVKKYRHSLSPELPYGYNHLDIGFDGNVITQEDHVAAIIDFDDLKYSPIVACLGFALRNILADEGEEAARHYLTEYEKTRSLSQLERETLPRVIFFRNYVIGITRLLSHENNPSEVNMRDILRLEEEIPTLIF